MHKSSILRMQWFASEYLKNKSMKKVLDVGSLDINGSYRSIFDDNFEYTGLDLVIGKNVDICVKNPYHWNMIESNYYDVVISGQALEHSAFFWVLFAEIIRVTKKNGIICIIVPRGFHKHRYPIDCWRFLEDGMTSLANYYGLEMLHCHTNSAPSPYHINWFSKNNADTMMVAQKPYDGIAQTIDTRKYQPVSYHQNYLPEGWFKFPFDGSLLQSLYNLLRGQS